MKKIKKRWEKELEDMLPGLKFEIINEPIPVKESKEVIKEKKPVYRYVRFVSAIAAVLVFCICAIPLLRIQEQNNPMDSSLPGDSTSNSTDTSSTPNENMQGSNGGSGSANDQTNNGVVNTEAFSVLTVEINPRVMFLSDKEGIVAKVIATNYDADVVLSYENFEESVIGKETKAAIVSYVEIATKLGYLKEENADSAVTITACEGDENEVVLSQVKEELEKHFDSKGFGTSVRHKVAKVKEICEINEIDEAEKIEDVVGRFKDKSPLFSERKFNELEGEELENYYRETIMNNAKDEVLSALDEMMLVLEIYELNQLVEQLCEGDYWSVIKDELQEPLQELITQIEEQLSLLTNEFGKEIQSAEQLKSIVSDFTKEQVKRFKDNVDSFEHVEDYKEILKILEKDASRLDKLDNIPSTKEEIIKENKDALQAEGNDRIEKNEGERPRPNDCVKGDDDRQAPDQEYSVDDDNGACTNEQLPKPEDNLGENDIVDEKGDLPNDNLPPKK